MDVITSCLTILVISEDILLRMKVKEILNSIRVVNLVIVLWHLLNVRLLD